MIPNLGGYIALFQGKPLQYKRATVNAVDLEAVTDVHSVVRFDGLITVMKSQEVNRKPENERRWKWWSLITRERIPLDSAVMDFDGLEFKIQNVDDWSQAGFFVYELTEQPRRLDLP